MSVLLLKCLIPGRGQVKGDWPSSAGCQNGLHIQSPLGVGWAQNSQSSWIDVC